jgi:hypothetical protein
VSLIEYVDNFEEVDTAFYNFISDCVIDGKPVPVHYYTPDLDLVEIAKPSIIFYRADPVRDLTRWKKDEIRDNEKYDLNGNLVSVDVRQPPEPYSITYNVRTNYEFQQDGVTFNRYFLRKFPRGSYLTIKNIGYDVELLSGGLWGSGYKDFGRVTEGKRIFMGNFSFRVNILLDLYERETVNITSSGGVSFNLGQK